jgi:hypothetical protein
MKSVEVSEEDIEEHLYREIQNNNLECRKAEYILHEIIDVIIEGNMLNFKRKSHINLLFMMTARCFMNCSWAFKALNKYKKDEMFLNHYKQI